MSIVGTKTTEERRKTNTPSSKNVRRPEPRPAPKPAPKSDPKTTEKKDNLSPEELAATANQTAGAAKSTSDFGATAVSFSKEARDIAKGSQAGVEGTQRSRNLSSALWQAYDNAEDVGGVKGKVVDTALTPISLAGNVKGTKDAIENLKNGNTLEGVEGLAVSGGGAVADGLGLVDSGASAVQGVTKLASGSANAANTASKAGTIITKAGNVAQVAGKASGVVGGAVAVVEGGFQVVKGVKEGDTEDVVVGGVKTAAGGMMLAGAMTGNPVLAAAGGLTYAGAAIYENREAIGKAAKAGAEFVGDTAKKVVDTQVQTAKAVGGAVVDGVEKVGEVADTVKDNAVGAAKKVFGSIF